MDEAKMALLVSHELAHYLQDHQVMRLCHSVLQEKVVRHIQPRFNQNFSKFDPVVAAFEKRTKLQRHSYFYP